VCVCACVREKKINALISKALRLCHVPPRRFAFVMFPQGASPLPI
jgi:hypothetical protein